MVLKSAGLCQNPSLQPQRRRSLREGSGLRVEELQRYLFLLSPKFVDTNLIQHCSLGFSFLQKGAVAAAEGTDEEEEEDIDFDDDFEGDAFYSTIYNFATRILYCYKILCSKNL